MDRISARYPRFWAVIPILVELGRRCVIIVIVQHETNLGAFPDKWGGEFVRSSAVAKQKRLSHASARETASLREIIRTCDELPNLVRAASFTQVDCRVFDSGVLNSIINQEHKIKADSDWSDRIERRRRELGAHIGKVLTCVFIRLPGVYYTIEVDESAGKVVYWEWQRA